MKDAIHHLKYVQKKVIQSIRKSANEKVQPNGESVNSVSFEEDGALPGRKPTKIPAKIRL